MGLFLLSMPNQRVTGPKAIITLGCSCLRPTRRKNVRCLADCNHDPASGVEMAWSDDTEAAAEELPFLWPLEALATGIAASANEAAAPGCSDTDSPRIGALWAGVLRSLIGTAHSRKIKMQPLCGIWTQQASARGLWRYFRRPSIVVVRS